MAKKDWFLIDQEDEDALRNLSKKEQIRRTVEKAAGYKVHPGLDYKTYKPDEDPDAIPTAPPPRSPLFYALFFSILGSVLVLAYWLIAVYLGSQDSDPSGAILSPSERLFEGLRRGFSK